MTRQTLNDNFFQGYEFVFVSKLDGCMPAIIGKRPLQRNGRGSDEAEMILVATGTQLQRPEGIPFDNTTIIDSDGIVNLKTLPKNMVIIGGGVIGVEYASIFSVPFGDG